VLRAIVLAILTACVSPLVLMGFGFARVSLVSPGIILGGLLAGYLWICQDVRSPGRLGAFVATCIGAYLVAVFSTLVFSVVPPILDDSISWGPGRTAITLAGMLGAGIVAAAFLMLLPNRGAAGGMGTEIVIVAAAGGALAYVGWSLERRSGSLPSLMTTPIWQSGIAGLLAVLAECRPVAGESAPPLVTDAPRPAFRPLSTSARTFYAIALGLMVLGGLWMMDRQRRGREYMAQWEQTNAASFAAAPPRVTLPPVAERPLDEVLILRDIGTFAPAGHSVKREPAADFHTIPGHAPPPEHLVYFAAYGVGGDLGRASVTIWQHPNTAWARYETRHFTGVRQQTIANQSILWSEQESVWYSGDKVVRVSGQGTEALPLIEAYLAKYPSALEPSFPLFAYARP
jgi:hypothetical protein